MAPTWQAMLERAGFENLALTVVVPLLGASYETAVGKVSIGVPILAVTVYSVLPMTVLPAMFGVTRWLHGNSLSLPCFSELALHMLSIFNGLVSLPMLMAAVDSALHHHSISILLLFPLGSTTAIGLAPMMQYRLLFVFARAFAIIISASAQYWASGAAFSSSLPRFGSSGVSLAYFDVLSCSILFVLSVNVQLRVLRTCMASSSSCFEGYSAHSPADIVLPSVNVGKSYQAVPDECEVVAVPCIETVAASCNKASPRSRPTHSGSEQAVVAPNSEVRQWVKLCRTWPARPLCQLFVCVILVESWPWSCP